LLFITEKSGLKSCVPKISSLISKCSPFGNSIFLERLFSLEVGIFPEFGRLSHEIAHVIYCGLFDWD